ncbi:hypothetical protein ACWOFR_17445 [Carnobacterium gallinarum]
MSKSSSFQYIGLPNRDTADKYQELEAQLTDFIEMQDCQAESLYYASTIENTLK